MKKLYIVLACAFLLCDTAGAAVLKNAQRRVAAVATPTVLEATDITATGFTANWKEVPGAAVYQVTTYEPITVSSSGSYIVLEEDFNLVGIGSFAEPAYLDDFYIDLVEKDMVKSPDWSALLPVFAKGMVAGVIYSPYVDLTNDGGKYTVHLGITGYSGGQVEVTSMGSTEQSKMLTLTTTGYNEFAVEFTNGTHDTFLTIVDYGIANDTEGLYADCFDFLDDFAISQELTAGDTILRLIEVAETSEDTPVTSWRFDDMAFRQGAVDLAYDVMAIRVDYTNPDDPYEYDTYYSDYSALQPVRLGAGVADIKVDDNAPATYYNLQGIEIDEPTATGIYIRRQGQTSSKFIVR